MRAGARSAMVRGDPEVGLGSVPAGYYGALRFCRKDNEGGGCSTQVQRHTVKDEESQVETCPTMLWHNWGKAQPGRLCYRVDAGIEAA